MLGRGRFDAVLYVFPVDFWPSTGGIAVLVIVLSVMNGFERELRERVLGVLPQGVIYSKSGFDDYPMMADKILQHPRVTGVAPFLEGSSLLVAGGEIRSVTFLAVDSIAETQVSIIGKHFIQGDLGSLKPREFNMAMGLAHGRAAKPVPR